MTVAEKDKQLKGAFMRIASEHERFEKEHENFVKEKEKRELAEKVLKEVNEKNILEKAELEERIRLANLSSREAQEKSGLTQAELDSVKNEHEALKRENERLRKEMEDEKKRFEEEKSSDRYVREMEDLVANTQRELMSGSTYISGVEINMGVFDELFKKGMKGNMESIDELSEVNSFTALGYLQVYDTLQQLGESVSLDQVKDKGIINVSSSSKTHSN